MPKFFTSITSCVKSILEGETQISEVEFIIVSTAYFRYETMRDQISRSFAGPNADRAHSISSVLWYSGRIFQSSVPSDTLNPVADSFPVEKVFGVLRHQE